MSKQSFLQLGYPINDKPHIGGWFASEKLDGQRCIWDGGVSRGLDKATVPWANCYKDERLVGNEVATGLWSRYGNIIHAPDWWLDSLPSVILDGELYNDGSRQTLRSAISRISGGDWSDVGYHVFDSPSLEQLFGDRDYEIRYGRSVSVVRMRGCLEWAAERWDGIRLSAGVTHRAAMSRLRKVCDSSVWSPVDEREISSSDEVGRAEVNDWAEDIVSSGGEGVIVRHPDKGWEPRRVHWLLKVKPRSMGVCSVIGVTAGTGRLVGMVGALVCEDDGITFELGTGLSDEDRKLGSDYWVGRRVHYSYRGRTDSGVPVEGAYKGIVDS